MALALDRKAFIEILSQGNDLVGAAMLPPPDGVWGMPAEELRSCRATAPDIEKNRAEARKIMEKLGYGAAKPLKVKVRPATSRSIAIPAVILIDQLKKIHIDGELEAIETHGLVHQGAAQGLPGRPEPDRRRHRRSGRQLLRELLLRAPSATTPATCNPEVDKLIDAQSAETDRDKRKKIVWEIERMLADDVARPIISYNVANTCWQPQVKGIVLQHNSIYNGWRFDNVWLDK